MGATLVLRLESEAESEADLRSVRISELGQKMTEIATCSPPNKDRLIVRLKERKGLLTNLKNESFPNKTSYSSF